MYKFYQFLAYPTKANSSGLTATADFVKHFSKGHTGFEMGNEQSLIENQSVRISNETEIPLVYVISQVSPLYWGVIQPGERVTRRTGRVWFTVTCYPYTGDNEPTNAQAVLGILIPTAAVLVTAVAGGIAAMGAASAIAPGTAGAALAPLVESPAVAGAAAAATVGVPSYSLASPAHATLLADIERAANKVEVKGHYANGDWLHVRGGIQRDVLHSAWQLMRFER